MGIPKFFRYISERYPLTSQLIQEDKIPEFDNLYLDFNGIIHNCSHPNDEDAHFRLSEEQIFTAIFAYVDHLFGKIKPQKLFFMAVDGVAPRAKMNQQRSRRFRTAKEAREVREKAERAGEKLPDEKAFDSNCITPGTLFMTKLSAQLRYFVNKKITEDANWQNVQVVLSGHEVPGEGEHKIMEYIRLSKAQPDYNPNVRHCLYGLDADLMMLGLLSHDPHFCLLREEVKFGPARKKGNQSLEATNFFLLHLSLLREYLDLEFQNLPADLSFPYNLERVIDDFVLMAVFVGNDFLPHLPAVHIHENALEKLFDVYKAVLPRMGGYLNESGVINTQRLQILMDELAAWERENFERETEDLSWYKGKQAKFVADSERSRRTNGSQMSLSKSQKDIFEEVKRFVISHSDVPPEVSREASLALPNTFAAKDRIFIQKLAQDLHLSLSWDEFDEQDQNVVKFRFPQPESGDEGENDEDAWEDEDPESREAIKRVLKKYDSADFYDPGTDADFDDREEKRYQEKMEEWKKTYYKDKLGFSYKQPGEVETLVFRYVEGLQWVMHYYYSGVASWSWFYDYHYSPRISDFRNVDKMEFKFELGTPFRPFEQLMGVLPAASKDLIPQAYQDLMYDSNSPLLDFYPVNFEQDMNGKKADWEAIVKIPFIDQARLLRAMAGREHRLTPEEKKRNSVGTSTTFHYDPKADSTYPSSLTGFFPDIHRCTCIMEPFNLPTLDGLHLIAGLCEGAFLGADSLAGFPSLKTLPYTAQLGYHHVNVFQSDSRNKSMVLHINNVHEGRKTSDIANELISKRTFLDWPFLQEGKVVAVSDHLFKHELIKIAGVGETVVATPHGSDALREWQRKSQGIEERYSKKTGVITGPIEVLLHIRPLKGLKRTEDGALIKDYEGKDKEREQAVQMSVSGVSSEDPRYLEKDAPPLHEDFPKGSKVFFLGDHAYGVAAQVSDTTDTSLSVVLAFFPSERAETQKLTDVVLQRKDNRYHPAYQVAQMLGLTGLGVSKITSSFMVLTADGSKVNVGLSIKFEAKSMKVLDYSRRGERGWEFSDKAVQLLKDYKAKFPQIFKVLDQRGDAMTRAADVFRDSNPDASVKAVKAWLNTQGVRDFEPVSLFSDHLPKEIVTQLEQLEDSFRASKTPANIKKAIVKGIPRQAVLKPAHAVYRLQNQRFELGDRVIMVQDTGGVPLTAKGVVIGLNSNSMEVVWDNAFLSGSTLSGRCSDYRGSTVTFNSCLNLTNPQFIASMNPQRQQQPPAEPFKPRFGPHPVVTPRGGRPPQGGFRPAPSVNGVPVHILANPNRAPPPARNANGSYGGVVSGNKPEPEPVDPSTSRTNALRDSLNEGFPNRGRGTNGRGRPPQNPNTRGGFVPNAHRREGSNTDRPPQVPVNNGRGRGNFMPNGDRGGRGFAPRGFRGRGRGRGAGAPPAIYSGTATISADT